MDIGEQDKSTMCTLSTGWNPGMVAPTAIKRPHDSGPVTPPIDVVLAARKSRC